MTILQTTLLIVIPVIVVAVLWLTRKPTSQKVVDKWRQEQNRYRKGITNK